MSAADRRLRAADPLIALWSERSHVAAQLVRLNTQPDHEADAASEPLIDKLVSIDDQIAAMVPISAAGAIVQLRILREDFEWGPLAEQIVDNLIAGLERLSKEGEL